MADWNKIQNQIKPRASILSGVNYKNQDIETLCRVHKYSWLDYSCGSSFDLLSSNGFVLLLIEKRSGTGEINEQRKELHLNMFVGSIVLFCNICFTISTKKFQSINYLISWRLLVKLNAVCIANISGLKSMAKSTWKTIFL